MAQFLGLTLWWVFSGFMDWFNTEKNYYPEAPLPPRELPPYHRRKDGRLCGCTTGDCK